MRDQIEKNNCILFKNFANTSDFTKKLYEDLSLYLSSGINTINEIPLPCSPSISLERMPTKGEQLFGREKERQLLHETLQNPKTRIFSRFAWGGVGKSALINQWLNQPAHDWQGRGSKNSLARGGKDANKA